MDDRFVFNKMSFVRIWGVFELSTERQVRENLSLENVRAMRDYSNTEVGFDKAYKRLMFSAS